MPDKTRDELEDQLTDLIEDNLPRVLEAICIVSPYAKSVLSGWVYRYTEKLWNHELRCIIESVKAK